MTIMGEVDSRFRRLQIIDGDAGTRRAVRHACEREGFEVVGSETGQEGIEQFDRLRPSAVLLETSLPDMSGYDVCRELRRKDGRVPILFMSSRTEEIDVVVGLELGA